MPSGVNYNHETVELDGELFDGCEFRACRMLYAGGEPPVFTDCKFDACDWKFEGAAARTLAQLRTLWNVGGKAPVQAMIKEITGAR